VRKLKRLVGLATSMSVRAVRLRQLKATRRPSMQLDVRSNNPGQIPVGSYNLQSGLLGCIDWSANNCGR
jgi:hypothetical protein